MSLMQREILEGSGLGREQERFSISFDTAALLTLMIAVKTNEKVVT
jgi:hypothetical protein